MLANKELIIKRRLFNFVYTVYPDNKENKENISLFFERLKKEKVYDILNDIEDYLAYSKIKYKKEFKYYKRITFKENIKAFKKIIIKEKITMLRDYIRECLIILKRYINNGEGYKLSSFFAY